MRFAGAFGADPAAVPLDDVPDDRQTDPKPPVNSGRKAARLAESFKNVRQELRTDADSSIADPDVSPARRIFQPHLDQAALVGKLYGIRQEVPDHLLDPVAVAPDQPLRVVEQTPQTNTQGLGGRPNDVDRSLDDRQEIGAAAG